MPDLFSGGMSSFMLEFKRFLMEYLFCSASTMLWYLKILLNLLYARGWEVNSFVGNILIS